MIRHMTRAELGELVDWAALEGWNPGLHDAECFWQTDPDGFIAAELDGQFVGGGSITSYDARFGFMGLFIIRPEFRGQGLGDALWQARKRLLLERLAPGSTIGMDGVFEMQSWYAKGGFELAHREIRFRGNGIEVEREPAFASLDMVPFARLLEYDQSCFGVPRERFLRAWTTQPQTFGLSSVADGQLTGFGIIRRCREGAKVGPLFADDAAIAGQLFDALASRFAGETVYLDVPEVNGGAMALVAQRGMEEVFGCARMYLGPAPPIPIEKVFGVTSFELG